MGQAFRDAFGHNMQGFRSIQHILIKLICQFNTTFSRQSHFDGICELKTEELVVPHQSYADGCSLRSGPPLRVVRTHLKPYILYSTGMKSPPLSYPPICNLLKKRVGHCNHDGFFRLPTALFCKASVKLGPSCVESDALPPEISLPVFCL